MSRVIKNIPYYLEVQDWEPGLHEVDWFQTNLGGLPWWSIWGHHLLSILFKQEGGTQVGEGRAMKKGGVDPRGQKTGSWLRTQNKRRGRLWVGEVETVWVYGFRNTNHFSSLWFNPPGQWWARPVESRLQKSHLSTALEWLRDIRWQKPPAAPRKRRMITSMKLPFFSTQINPGLGNATSQSFGIWQVWSEPSPPPVMVWSRPGTWTCRGLSLLICKTGVIIPISQFAED